MKVDPITHRAWLRPDRLFLVFKYSVFILLTINGWFFFREDANAAPLLFQDGVTWGNFIEAYSATVDTVAWLILLWLFELETAVIPDERLRGGLKWVLTGVRTVCYLFIISAFWGYLGNWFQVTGLEPFVIADPCSLVGSGMSWIDTLDEYPLIDAAACAGLQGQELVRILGTDIIGTAEAAEAIGLLALVDVINSGDWLLVVLVLEVEVLLQLWDRLGPRLVRGLKIVKAILYTVLFAAAVYWGMEGDFLDFWDAFLWLVAFVFIELNIFQWQAEVEEEKAHGHRPGYLDPDEGGSAQS